MTKKTNAIFLSLIFILIANATADGSQVELFRKKLMEYNDFYFHKGDELLYMGSVHDSGKKFDIYINTYLFRGTSQSSYRMARRLIFYSEGEILGCYRIVEKPVVENNRIVFPYKEKYGNEIKIKDGKLPERVRLEGDLIDLDTHRGSDFPKEWRHKE